jgi:peptide/nickel transport system permease protein
MSTVPLPLEASRTVPARLERAWKIVVRARLPWLAFLILCVLLVLAAMPQVFAPHDPFKQSLIARFRPPFWAEGGSLAYPLGTDALGRDILSRIIYGSRVSLTVAAFALFFGGVIGTGIGLASGYFRGRMDAFLMRVADSMLAFPMILFAMLLAVSIGSGTMTVVIAVSLVIWARFARIIRGEVLSLRERGFVKLAQIAGCSTSRILLVHILPNILGTLAVLLTVQLGWVIIVEASLSFLGAGIPPPMPAWGSMIAEGRTSLTRAWWASTMPGIALMLTVLSFNTIGDWLRDAIDPKMRRNYRIPS